MTNSFNRFLPWVLFTAVALSVFGLMLNASRQESAIMDELAHIPAGYGYVKYLDFRLNPEHPPLVKAIAAIPLLFQNLKFPTDSSAWQKEVNGQWQAGAQFLYESGNNADQIIGWARLGPMLLTILLLIFIYIWAKELIGRWWALLPAFLFGLSPTVLAHGHYVTTDIGAALGIFLASYYFIKFLLKSNRNNLIFAGLAFGVSQLMKFSAVLLIPFFGIMLIFFCLSKTRNILEFLKIFVRYILYLILIFLIGYILVYIIYFIFTINYPIEKQQADTKFILASFAEGPDPNWETCQLNSGISLARRGRCLANINIWMAGSKILRPLGEYMLGVMMVFQRSAGGNTSYFLGQVSASGWWYYFPVVFGLKESIPSLILIALALLLSIWKISKSIKYQVSSIKRKFLDYLVIHFAEFSMLAFVIFYWAYSIQSPLNIGVRHILPTLPFIYILTASGIKKWVCDGKYPVFQMSLKRILGAAINFLKMFIKGGLIAILLIWYLTETLLASPYFLSYFNEFGGGIYGGYKYVTDSNYDWGQDLKRLKNFVDEKNIDKIGVDYFGGGNLKYYLGDKVEPWWSARGNPKNSGIQWLAVSINSLQGALAELAPGQKRNPQDEYSWLKQIKNPYQPDFKAGTSIFIYKL